LGVVLKKRKLVYGVGINDSDYVTLKSVPYTDKNGKRKYKRVWACPFHTKWESMLARCYGVNKAESYEGCYVVEEWLRFSNFKAWMETQDWEGKELDKDLLSEGNKVYSPETCVFISRAVNLFIVESSPSKGKRGVDFDKRRKLFRSRGYDLDKNSIFIGYFSDELSAYKAYLENKILQASDLASKEKDPRIAKALRERYVKILAEL